MGPKNDTNPSGSDVPQIPFLSALELRSDERDHKLQLDVEEWATGQLSGGGWRKARGHYERTIKENPAEGLEFPLWEGMFRFPSAPLHGLHRVHAAQYNLGVSENFHSYRVLARQRPTERPKCIYLMQNGLNEWNKLGLYYQLASRILNEPSNENAVCIVRPFPGHLSRYPFDGFSPMPLDRYLADGSHLFRQFMRYMVETQWFLSVLVTRSRYWCPSGAMLLGNSRSPIRSRLDAEFLARTMRREWLAQHRASRVALKQAAKEQGASVTKPSDPPPEAAFHESIQSIRHALKWDEYPLRTEERPNVDERRAEEPFFHVVGYSLGGFTAQSILISWPFAVASCSTLLSGGALRELSPTAFAHPEEWQTVLHSLRYELDYLMSRGYFTESNVASAGDKRIAGVPSQLFLYLQRIFYEVFQQEYRGSYQTRVSEFGRRMLFVVGGKDPIVRTRSVLDSAPAEGVNLIQIARLGHFLGSPTRDVEEIEQRKFWLPQVADTIARFANNTVSAHVADLAQSWIGPDTKSHAKRVVGPAGSGTASGPESSEAKAAARAVPAVVESPRMLREDERMRIGVDGSMPSPLFERGLDDLVARVRKGGYLFVLRNEVPTAFLPVDGVRRKALAIHHDNQRVLDYTKGVVQRGNELLDHVKRVVFVLPQAADVLAVSMDPPHGLPSQSETPVGQLPPGTDEDDIWRRTEERALLFHKRYLGSVRSFQARAVGDVDALSTGAAAVLQVARRDSRVGKKSDVIVTTLPDCWMWVSGEALDPESQDDVVLPLAERLDLFYRFVANAFDDEKGKLFDRHLRVGNIRIAEVSRARFNPRFRGRIVLDPKSAKGLVLHAAMCLLASSDGIGFSLQKRRAARGSNVTR